MAIAHDPEDRSRIGGTPSQTSGDGEVLFERHRQPIRARQYGKRFGDKVFERIVETVCELSDHPDLVTFGVSSGQNVARLDESEQCFELVIAILAPLADMQREVDFGVSDFAHGRLPPSRVGVRRHIFG